MPIRRTNSLVLALCAVSAIGCGSDQLSGPDTVDWDISYARGGVTAGLTAPSSALASGVSASQIDLRWQDNSTNENQFEIYRSTDGPGGSYSLLSVAPRNITSYSDSGLQPASQYCYAIRAVGGSAKTFSASSLSSPACTRTIPAPAYEARTPPTTGGILLFWKAVGVSFRIEKSTDNGVSWSVAGTVDNERYFNSGAVADQLTCLRVINFNESGEAAPSNTACATLPAAPTGFAVTAANAETLSLTWTDNSSVEDAYEVWFMQDQGSCGDGHSGVFNYEIRLAILPRDTRSYQAPGVLGEDMCGVTSWYEVRSVKDGSYSGASFVIDP